MSEPTIRDLRLAAERHRFDLYSFLKCFDDLEMAAFVTSDGPEHVLHPLLGELHRFLRRDVLGDWQSMETAPKDGTRILVWVPGLNHSVCIAAWFEQTTTELGVVKSQYAEWNYSNWWKLGQEDRPQPTHWMPLPEAPETKEKQHG